MDDPKSSPPSNLPVVKEQKPSLPPFPLRPPVPPSPTPSANISLPKPLPQLPPSLEEKKPVSVPPLPPVPLLSRPSLPPAPEKPVSMATPAAPKPPAPPPSPAPSTGSGQVPSVGSQPSQSFGGQAGQTPSGGAVPPPVAPVNPLPPIKSFVRTMPGDIKSLQQGQKPTGQEVKVPALFSTPAGPKPAPPGLPPKTPPPPIKSVPIAGGIAIPPQVKWWRQKKALLTIGVAVVVIGGGLASWLVVRDRLADNLTTPTPSVSTSPPALPTETPKLNTFFSIRYSLNWVPMAGQELPSLLGEVEKIDLKDTSRIILLNPLDSESKPYSFSDFLGELSIQFPTNLSSNLDEEDFDLVLFKQKEKFDDKGVLLTETSANPRVALIVRVTDSPEAKTMLSEWEETMAEDFHEFFDLTEETPKFLTGIYRDVSIRYDNFPYPDVSLDYAIVTARNNDDFLVIANSREQTYAIIDSLLGFDF